MTTAQQQTLSPSFAYQIINGKVPNQQTLHYAGDSDMTQPGDNYGLSGTTTADNSESVQYCLICNDKATGKHYGAYSCDGCKGFFRRSVRKKSNYTCQYNRNCKMDKDKRNQCRYCRLKKCILVGMKRAAVQNERDRISTRRSSFEDIPPNMLLSIPQLMQAEQRIALQKIPHSQDFMHRLADVGDVCESMKNQLFLLVNWAKSLPCFSQLSLNDQIALLKAHAGEILILGVIKRSFQLEEDDVLLLGNNLIISRNSGDKHFAEIACHILDDLFIPLRELQLDEAEFTCLKAIVFFDPKAVAVSDHSKEFIRRCRYQIQMDLMNHMNDKQYHKAGRFGELLLSIPDLRYVTQMMVKKVEFMKMTGLAEIDSLLSETLLGDNANSIFDVQSNTDSNNNSNNGYNPPHSSGNYDSINLLRSELHSPPLNNCQNIYSIPSFMPNSILLDINSQNISQEAANHIWRTYIPNSNSMTPEHVYNAFVREDGMPHSQQDARLLNNMIINSDGMMLKGESVGMQSLFSSVNDSIGLYQHSGNGPHDSANFLVNLDQNFQILSQQQSNKYGHNNHDDIINSHDNHSIDPSLLATYSKSLPNSPIDNCHLQVISNRSGDSNIQHKPMALYSHTAAAAQLTADQHQRKNDSHSSSLFKSEDY